MTRIAISGMGAVSACGVGIRPLWDHAVSARSATRPHDIPRGERLRVRVAASVPDFVPEDHLSEDVLRFCERYAQFAMVATAEAIANAGVGDGGISGSGTAVIMATGAGGLNTMDDGCYTMYSGVGRHNPLSLPRELPSTAAAQISMAYGITGPVFAVASACSSASQAVGLSMQLIRAGIIDRAIAGGSEAPLTPVSMRGWELLRVMSPDVCRPFSAGRRGMIVGEGAGAFILESEAALSARGGEPLAWLSGYGTTSDARDMLQPDTTGAANAMRAAIADSGLAPDEIGYINAHGTGTVRNDINEAVAIREVFGDIAEDLPVSSSKAVFGHALGAAGGLELAVTVEALRNGRIPPQANFVEPDADCPLFLPVDGALDRPITAAMSNSFAFGGINAALIVTRA